MSLTPFDADYVATELIVEYAELLNANTEGIQIAMRMRPKLQAIHERAGDEDGKLLLLACVASTGANLLNALATAVNLSLPQAAALLREHGSFARHELEPDADDDGDVTPL